MKKYEEPVVNVITFAVEDIMIDASSLEGSGGDGNFGGEVFD